MGRHVLGGYTSRNFDHDNTDLMFSLRFLLIFRDVCVFGGNGRILLRRSEGFLCLHRNTFCGSLMFSVPLKLAIPRDLHMVFFHWI